MAETLKNINSLVIGRFTQEEIDLAKVTPGGFSDGQLYIILDSGEMWSYTKLNGHQRISFEEKTYLYVYKPATPIKIADWAIGSSQTVTIGADLDYVVGDRIDVSFDRDNYWIGDVTAYNKDTGVITFTVDDAVSDGVDVGYSIFTFSIYHLDRRTRNVLEIRIITENYTALVAQTQFTPSDGDLAWCSSSQGTPWLPGSLLGTWYPAGVYVYDGTDSLWKFQSKTIAEGIYEAVQNQPPLIVLSSTEVKVQNGGLVYEALSEKVYVNRSGGDVTGVSVDTDFSGIEWREIEVAGDVTLAGDNVFTGSNRFTKATAPGVISLERTEAATEAADVGHIQFTNNDVLFAEIEGRVNNAETTTGAINFSIRNATDPNNIVFEKVLGITNDVIRLQRPLDLESLNADPDLGGVGHIYYNTVIRSIRLKNSNNGDANDWITVGAGSGGVVNLTSTPSATNVVISAGSGTEATIAAADASIAGVVTTGAQAFAGNKTFNDNVTITGNVDVGGNTIFMSQNSKLEIFESGGGFDPDVQTSLFSQGLIESKQPDGESLAVLRVSQDTVGAISNSLSGHIGFLGFNAKKSSPTNTARDYVRFNGYAINTLNVINPTNARGRFTLDVADGTENTDGDPNYVDLIDAQQSKIDLNTTIVNINGNANVTGNLEVDGNINSTITFTTDEVHSNKGMLITADQINNVDDAYLQLRVNAFNFDPAIYGSYIKHGRVGARALSSYDGEPFVVAETDTIPVVGTVLGGLAASAKGTTFDSSNADEAHVYNDFGKIEAVSTSVVTEVASGVNTTIESEWRVQPYKAGVAHTSLVVKPDEVIINNEGNTIHLPKLRPTSATQGFPEWNTDGTFKGWASGGGGGGSLSVDGTSGVENLNTGTNISSTVVGDTATFNVDVTNTPTGFRGINVETAAPEDDQAMVYNGTEMVFKKITFDNLSNASVQQVTVDGVQTTTLYRDDDNGTAQADASWVTGNYSGDVTQNYVVGNGVRREFFVTDTLNDIEYVVTQRFTASSAAGSINYDIRLERINESGVLFVFQESLNNTDQSANNTTDAAAQTAFELYNTLTKLQALTWTNT